MKNIITLSFLFFFLQINAQESTIYTEAGTSFFLQAGPVNNLYSKLISVGNSSVNSFNEAQSSEIDRSISLGIGLELVRGNVGFRLQTNRVKIDETFESSSSFTENSFGQFNSENSAVIRGEQINYEIVPGIHRYFQVNKWIVSAGIETPFTIYDIYKFSQSTQSDFSSSSGDFTFQQTVLDDLTGEIPGGYDVGIGANFGLQYAFTNSLKVAIQYAPSMRHYKIGGETQFVRRFRQSFSEEIQGQSPVVTNESSVSNTDNTNTQSKIAEFRQKMNFALVFSF